MGMIIKNGTILSANDEFIGDIFIEGDKIIQIGVNLCEDGQ